jgi:cob(I)alamin adenosyltransferase
MSEDDLNARHAEKMRKKKAARDKILATKTIEKGLLIVHTGKGKGKSTAAFGMVFRALGHGFRVGVVQFVKGIWQTGERVVLDKFPDLVTIKAMGEGFTWETQDRARDIAAARQAWEEAKAMIADPSYRMVLLDELNIVLRYDYLPLDEVVEVLSVAAARHPRHRHRPQRQGRDHRDRRPGHRDGDGQAPLPLRRQGAGRDRVLMAQLHRPIGDASLRWHDDDRGCRP